MTPFDGQEEDVNHVTPELHDPARWYLNEDEVEFVGPFLEAAVQLRKESEDRFNKAMRLAIRLKSIPETEISQWRLVGDGDGKLYLIKA